MIETGVLVDKQGAPLHWHTPANRTSTALPDSRDLWEMIWKHRANLLGFAHTHPGRGVPGPSDTDLTTFAAVEEGLGLRLNWWVVNEDNIIVIRWIDSTWKASFVPLQFAPWATQLRALSF